MFDSITALLLDIEQRQRSLDADRADALVEWERSREWADDGSVTASGRLARETVISVRVARERLQVSRLLASSMPLTRTALDALGWAKAKLLATVAGSTIVTFPDPAGDHRPVDVHQSQLARAIDACHASAEPPGERVARGNRVERRPDQGRAVLRFGHFADQPKKVRRDALSAAVATYEEITLHDPLVARGVRPAGSCGDGCAVEGRGEPGVVIKLRRKVPSERDVRIHWLRNSVGTPLSFNRRLDAVHRAELSIAPGTEGDATDAQV